MTTRVGHRGRWGGGAILGLLLLMPGGAASAPARVPLKIQLALLTKIFSQDSSLNERNKIRVQVVYDPAAADSVWLKTEMSELARDTTALAVGGRAVDMEVVPLEGLRTKAPCDIYFLCALSEGAFHKVLQTARDSGVRCFGSEPGDARRGAAVSLGIAEGKPKIIINRAAAEAQGARFLGTLLKLADVI